MRVKYFWHTDEYLGVIRVGYLRPDIKVSSVPMGYKCLFASFLSDDGGSGCYVYEDGFTILRDKIDEIISGDCQTEDAVYCTESWCAEVSNNDVIISFSYDETYYEIINIKDFQYALKTWLEFIKTTPSLEASVEIELNEPVS
jgi:hypothetical protein